MKVRSTEMVAHSTERLMSMATLAMANWVPGLMIGVFLLISIMLILVVLIQRPQGGGLGGAFGAGGSGETTFGAKTGDALTIATVSIFILWLALAVGLVFATRPPVDGAVTNAEPAAASTDPADLTDAATTDTTATDAATPDPTTEPTTEPAAEPAPESAPESDPAAPPTAPPAETPAATPPQSEPQDQPPG